jgi:hypothetical protein
MKYRVTFSLTLGGSVYLDTYRGWRLYAKSFRLFASNGEAKRALNRYYNMLADQGRTGLIADATVQRCCS